MLRPRARLVRLTGASSRFDVGYIEGNLAAARQSPRKPTPPEIFTGERPGR